MSVKRQCSHCEADLTATDPGVRCPRCLLELGLNDNEPEGDALGASAKSGEYIGRYKLLQQIGEGGCGVVYMAEQEEPVRRRVALKVIKLGMDTKSVIARFEAERQALAMMDHPNIARVFDGGATEQGRPYFVMELVRGIKITDYCDQHELSMRERLELFIKVCEAVQHAHQKGIIHRDLKPSNILVTVNDGSALPKVIDFGVAKATEHRLTEKTLFTRFESFIGTPAYMSPEQAEMSSLDIDTRSDIYSLGVLLYELLTGQTPVDARTLAQSGIEAMRRTIREVEPARPSTRLRSLDDGELTTTAKRRRTDGSRLINTLRGDLDWIVMRCLEKDRARRYETAINLAADIRRSLIHEPIVARPPSTAYRFQKLVRRNKVAFGGIAAVTTVIVLGGIVSTWQAVRAVRAERNQKSLRIDAEQAEKVAKQKATLAENVTKELRHELYAADMAAVADAWEAGNVAQMLQLLEGHRPRPGQEDLRGFEWYYFKKLTSGEQKCSMTLPVDLNEQFFETGLAVSSDGTLLAYARTNELAVLKIGPPAEVICRVPLRDDSLSYRTCAFTRDGRLIGVTGSDGLHLYDIEKAHHRIESTGACNRMMFSPAGHLVVVYCKGVGRTNAAKSSIRIWDYEARKQVQALPDPTSDPLCWLSDKQLIIKGPKGGFDPLVYSVWTIASATSVALKTGFRGVPTLASDDGRLLLQGNYDGDLCVTDLETMQHPLRVTGFPVGQFEASFSNDGKWFAVTTPENRIDVWRTADATKVATLRGHTENVLRIRFGREASNLISFGFDKTARLWDFLATAGSNNVIETHPYQLMSAERVQFSPDGRLLALPVYGTAGKPECALLDTATRSKIATFPEPPIRFSPDGRQLLTSGLDKSNGSRAQLRRWDIASQQLLAEIDLNPVENRLLAPNGKTVALAERASGILRIMDLNGFVYRELANRGITTWAFSPDSQWLVMNDSPGNVNDHFFPLRMIEVVGNRERLITNCSAASLAFSADGRLLAAGTYPPGVNLVDVESGQVLAKLKGHHTLVTAVAFAPDGKSLASGAQDRTVRFYNLATRRQTAVVKFAGTISRLAFSPDQELLVVDEIGGQNRPPRCHFLGAPRVNAHPLPLAPPRSPEIGSIWLMGNNTLE